METRFHATPWTTDVVIVGAGPAGLALACALAPLGLRIELVERQPRHAIAEPAFDGREIALTHGSMRLLRELGIWAQIPATAISPLRTARVIERDVARELQVGTAGTGHDRLGSLVSNQAIRAAAWQTVQSLAGVQVHAAAAVDAVHTDARAAEVRLADGRVLRAGLLVAADSRFSQTRQALGIGADMHDFGRHMLVCRMRHEVANDAAAWQWFGDAQTRALLPLEPHLSSVVLTLTGAGAQRMERLDDDAFAREVEQRFEHRLGAMTPVSTRHRYPLTTVYARRFVATRAALVGDAAVGMHPVTAHGFNLGLASVERLAGVVRDALQRHADPAHPRALAMYQRRHRRGSLPLFLATATVAGLYGDDRASMRPLRRAALEAAARLTPFRRALAAGLVDDGPVDVTPAQRVREALRWLRPG
ncbi:5-demethoxyubiquinol-8 5-hydroxylase UbiM [Luteimonas yindakuii]|uniref:5-demethoxyubiquinol-8 5-hydroxylase UbiM n=1 Tax=Luteimonas yindakuii TaxID=2565782 RepID=A0A4Z1R6E4_9GAMM|nr:5-demethoxyubiquinol-8 5-hydroxylase UbiM [Luteimonas yindakuii]TKS54105.1 5-demethoxyubiquinol-8 5-hydroxylase UbiM [Luteimonas yindakuii]